MRLREHSHEGGAGREGIAREVTASNVFVCAGALGTTELLLRSRDQHATLPDLPAGLGLGYSGNGDFLSFGRGMSEPFESGAGPTITTAALLHTHTAGDENWFVLEDGGFSPHYAPTHTVVSVVVMTTRLGSDPQWRQRVAGRATT